MTAYAHSRPGTDRASWHDLAEHLTSTAALAESFAGKYAPGWGHQAALWHDLGKYQPRFQQKLFQSESGGFSDRVEHAILGALHAHRWNRGPIGEVLALCIAAHHGSLKSRVDLKGRFDEEPVKKWLQDAIAAGPPASILEAARLEFPPAAGCDRKDAALWVRFLFSALVDADSLETEAWHEGRSRPVIPQSISDLAAKLDIFLEERFRDEHDTEMNRLRRYVLACCRKRAVLAPGHFTLTVPTGGGKTYSALNFALNHGVSHGQNRVIAVLPFTTVLDQTVSAYQAALGNEAVIEHHSNIDVDKESLQNRQATENWDATVIVTTSVQFLESLYAAHKRRCRKLHNIAGSVVILDEVQTFPLGLITPIRSALDLLVKHYGVTVVHCSATQPHLAHEKGPQEIVDEPRALFTAVKQRITVSWPDIPKNGEPEKWDITTLRDHAAREVDSTLVIVHRRKEAEELARLWGEGVIHLSARMSGAHRLEVIDHIKERLRKREHVKLVATQLVEAGVDIDFPVVYRAAAGLDTMAQAAGRCNREGTQHQPGKFVVFWPDSEPPAEPLKKSLAETLRFLRENPEIDLANPDLFPKFFKSLIRHTNDPTGGLVLQAESDWDFPRSAELFRMIKEAGEPVIAPYGEKWKERLENLRLLGPSRERLRGLQRYVVNLYPQEITKLQSLGALEPAHRDVERLWSVAPRFEDTIYGARFGFTWAADDPEPPFLLA